MSHDVVLTGFRLNTGETPAKVLERVLGIDAAKARKATQRFPVILARTSQERAERIAAALSEAGALVELHETEPDEAAEAPPPSRSSVGLPAVSSPAPQATQQAAAHAVAHAPTLIQRPSSEPFVAAPALSSAEPANDWTLESAKAPATAIELETAPEAARPRAMTAYQLGELSLDLGPKAAPSAPAEAPAPKLPSAAPVQKPKASAPEASGTGGMQSFGDGFDDDVNDAAPALELDTDARWRHAQKPSADTEPLPRASAPAAEEAGRPSNPRRAAAPAKYVAPAPRTGLQRLGDRLLDLLHTAKAILAQGLVLAVVTAITLAAVGYARSPDALFELTGLGSPPAVPREVRIAYVRPGAVPNLVSSPRIHPLLRLAPDPLAVQVAVQLRDAMAGVERVPVTWPESQGLHARHVECVLVAHANDDPKDAVFKRRLHALLRTGHPLAVPPEVQPVLRTRLLELEQHAKGERFTELCLAL